MLESQLLLGDRVKLKHLTASGGKETQAGTESKTIVTRRRRLEMIHEGGMDAFELSTSITTAEKRGERQPERLGKNADS